jgi:hypothetical protein
MSRQDGFPWDEDLLLQLAAEVLGLAAPSLEAVVALGREAWDLHHVTGASPSATRHPRTPPNPSTIRSRPR